ncbi:MAG: DUF4349 domain-containing protein [Methanoregulaceae archaeon]|nr:DUF4349 domain-containing protein [Methanoregulaceae archaeon]
MIRRIVVISTLLVLLLAGAGCLSNPWDGDTATLDEKSAPVSAGSGFFSENARYPVPTIVPTYAPGYTGDTATDQKVIRTGSVNLEVGNVTTTLDPLKGIAIAHGGYLGSMSVNTQYGDRLYAVLTMRVPAREFDSTLTEIKMLGTLKSESLSADDVTEEYVDLQARRTALANQLAQYNRIMEQAENVSEILDVQVQIERVQVELDRIDGRLKYLDNRVDYATITVTLEEPEPVGGGEGFSIVTVINESIAGFLAVTAGLIILLISIIPLIILGIIAYGSYRWWKGRKGERQKVPEEKKREGGPPGQ